VSYIIFKQSTEEIESLDDLFNDDTAEKSDSYNKVPENSIDDMLCPFR
jgi:hypothetical protein